MSSDSPRDEGRLDALLHEDRRFPPPPDFSREATISDPEIRARADADFETFWSERAKELDWFTPWDRVLDWQPPVARWFDGGRLNASWNCLDRHVAAGKGERTALIWEGEPGDSRTFTYAELLSEVARFAAVLRGLGVKRGDRVAIYLPMIPEAVIAILACARLGAPHSVVFGGFSPDSLSDRIRDAGAEVVITGDVGYRRGRLVPLKENTDRALLRTPGVRSVIVVARGGTASREAGITMTEGRDLWYHDLMAQTPTGVDAEPMEAEDVLFILYTSGTTGRPKGVVHTTGGYLTQVHATTRWVLDLQDRDVFFCTADIGWVTGHSYVVYGPLAAGGTVLIYEGAPDTPHRGRFWELCERWGVTILYTAPTAIRAFMKWGAEWVDRHDLSRLRLLGSVGEPINPEAWNWYREVVGGGRCPVVDTWWQTETGAIMIAPLPGITVTTPGSATRPFPGTSALVLDGKGDPAKAGYLAIPRPWPSMLRTIWGDDARYRETYWSKWGPEIYFPGDSAKEDAHGDLWILGRVDDVLNVAGHRIGTMEVESALVDHPAVAEAAVVGKSHDVKGEAIAAFVTLRDRSVPSSELMEELGAHVVEKIGAIARPDQVLFAADLPKTRSGKIMRRLLRDIAEGKMLGDTTTLSDPAVVARLKEEYENTED